MKKVLFIPVVLILVILLAACLPVKANAEQNWPLKIWKQNDNGSMSTLCVVDEDTGVNYIVVSGKLVGHNSISVTITPRLNADGSLYISD